MKKVSQKYTSMLAILLLTCITRISAGDTLTVGFWNVENVFDLEDDPYTNDNEFAIGGKKRVTEAIYIFKMKNIASVMEKVGADILGVCEVENRFV
ncbi:MAG: endonuclease, partial [Candidatus Marinimicrobia bacterium]|nr:endonuclease [Candidatus Neomarinimicrobiota bacterium]